MTDLVPRATRALGAMTEGLAADGYALSVGEDATGRLIVGVTPLETACADCLVSKTLFEQMIRLELNAAGLDLPIGAIDLRYPIDEAH